VLLRADQHVLNHCTIDATDLAKNHPPRFLHVQLVGDRIVNVYEEEALELPKSIKITVPMPMSTGSLRINRQVQTRNIGI
jgi:hypothetical protein